MVLLVLEHYETQHCAILGALPSRVASPNRSPDGRDTGMASKFGPDILLLQSLGLKATAYNCIA
jgi:hypothetical protein